LFPSKIVLRGLPHSYSFSLFVPSVTHFSTTFFPHQQSPSKKICRGLIFRSKVPSCSLFTTVFSFVALFLKTPGRPSLLPSPNFDALRFLILHSLFYFRKVGKFLQGETKIDRGEALYLSFFLQVLRSIFSDEFSLH